MGGTVARDRPSVAQRGSGRWGFRPPQRAERITPSYARPGCDVMHAANQSNDRAVGATVGGMGQVFDRLNDRLRDFIAEQHIYFVATAPSGTEGHVNVSPKGHTDTFAILSDTQVAYLDLTGSGAETAAHLRDNGRITLMFCAFDGPPNVLRLYGRGRLVIPTEPEFSELAARFAPRPGARSVVVIDIDRVSTTCGFAVPLYEYVDDRDVLEKSNARKTAEDLETYHRTRNAVSIDGLPALPIGGEPAADVDGASLG